MKSLFFSILLLLLFIACTAPTDPAYESKFKMLDPTDSSYPDQKAALCVELLQSIKKDTFAAARLQEKMDESALKKTSVPPADREELKKLYDLLLFENREYAQYCAE